MALRDPAAVEDLAHLRQGALTRVLFSLGGAWYIWCVALFFSGYEFRPAWYGPATVGAGLAAAIATRRRCPRAAAIILILALTAADLHAIWLYGVQVAPYLLAVVVILTGLMFDLGGVLLATALTSGLIFIAGTQRWGYAMYSAELLGPVLVIGAVGIFSAISVRNLYLALYWAVNRAKAAHRHEQELRERRGELAQTAKALDEACQRLEHLNYDLARAREAADETRLLKQQFISNVSHELRTPLNVILAFSEMMYLSPEGYGGVPLPAEYQPDVREIYHASQSLLRLVDDLLDLSQFEAQRMKLHPEPTSLAEVVAEAVGIMHPLLRGKDIRLCQSIPPDLPLLLVDRARVRQVLLNLLNNARRFTERGVIEVSATLEPREVRVTVSDTGIGIKPEDYERIFEEFRQRDGSTTRQRDGSGLGLAISKRFVEMHGGRIWVESEGIPGRGSRFHWTLPLYGPSSEPAAAGLQRVPVALMQPHSRGRPLVLLERDPTIARLLEERLEAYRVVLAADVAGAAEMAVQMQARAVIVNAAHGRRAWRVARALQHQVPKTLPIILCPLVCEQELGQSMGVVSYLTKPVSRVKLGALLDGLPNLRRILIIDDDRQMAYVLSRMIAASGHDCEIMRAFDGARGLERMKRTRPDLVLLDIAMPGMDGREVLARMREDAELRTVPVAVVTGQELTPEDERRLGGPVLQVAMAGGFAKEDALRYLGAILEASALPAFATAEAGSAGSGVAAGPADNTG